MSLLLEGKSLGHVLDAVIHFNRAHDLIGDASSSVDVSSRLFDALNKIQTEWALRHPEQVRHPENPEREVGEVKKFQLTLIDGLDSDRRTLLAKSKELRSLVAFEPQVMNHDTLRRREYRPDTTLAPDLVRDATQVHRQLVKAHSEMSADSATEDRVLKKAAELLYIVRSNIAHGEKTPYGPDLGKRPRDENVAAVVVPLQLVWFDYLLDCPRNKLVAYGTLAPGEPNHRVISDLPGVWESCTLHGSVTLPDHLPVFSWNPLEPAVEARLFVSQHLSEAWPRIDQFEGAAYKRRLIPVNTSEGVTVASIYLSANQ